MVPTDGVGGHTVDFEEHPVKPGIVLHIGPGQVHRLDPEAGFDAFLVKIDPSGCPPSLLAARHPGPVVELSSSAATVVRSLAEALMTESGRPGSDPEILLSGAMLLLDQLARAAPVNGSASRGHVELVRRFEEEVEQNFARSRTVSAYARSIGTSTKTLSRATASVAGCGPKELVDRRVTLEAKRLLTLSSEPIAAIGSRLGFSDPTNFTKFFARNCAETPQEFRATNSF